MKNVLLFIGLSMVMLAQSATPTEALTYFKNKQYEKALPIFLESSEKGDTKSQSYVARIYLNGLGTSQNFEKALYWASKASVKNDPTSQGIMGYLYLNGYGGLIKDNVKALSYYRKAADQDNTVVVERYAEVVLHGHTKQGLEEIEKALIKDKSISSALVLKILYSSSQYKPSNLYKSYPYALEAIRRGASSPIWWIIETSKYLQFPDWLNAAWLKALNDLKNPEVDDFPDYQSDLKEAIDSLTAEETHEVKRIKLSELIVKTEKYVSEHQKKYGPITSSDFIDEGWVQFSGRRGYVNEPLAQFLLEEGLKKAISMREKDMINLARNNLGVVFGAAINPNIRNKRLAQVHIIDGADSEYGPDNLIWYSYQGKIELPDDEFKTLLKRYKDLSKENHIFEYLGPLPTDLKNKPNLIIEYLIKKFEEKPDYQIAEQIADMYEDNYTNFQDLIEAKKWYEIRNKLNGEDTDERLSRIKTIISGDYVKDMPDLRNSIDNLFELIPKKITNYSTIPQVAKKEEKAPLANQKPKLYALVIGNSEYQSGRLSNAINDANLMTTKLKGLGFNVTYAPNLNRKSFMSSLINFSDKAKDADVTVFYYSGHGMQLGGVNYLLPTDIDFKGKEELIALNGISLNDLIRRNLPGKSKIVFLDACRTKPYKSSSNILVNHGLAPVNVPRGTLISFAAKDGGIAFDGAEGKNSPYTGALASLIGEKEDIAIILRNVRDDVLKVTQGQQEPWEYGSLSGGKFVLSNIVSQ